MSKQANKISKGTSQSLFAKLTVQSPAAMPCIEIPAQSFKSAYSQLVALVSRNSTDDQESRKRRSHNLPSSCAKCKAKIKTGLTYVKQY